MGDPALLFYCGINPVPDVFLKMFSSFCSWMIIRPLKCFWETRPYPLQTPSWSVTGFGVSVVLSLAPFITSRGFLELEKGPSCAEACSRLVRHAKCQASWGVDARVAEVKAWAAAATKTCTQTASCGLTGGGEGKRRTPSPHPTKSWPTTKTCGREWHGSQFGLSTQPTLGMNARSSVSRAHTGRYQQNMYGK